MTNSTHRDGGTKISMNRLGKFHFEPEWEVLVGHLGKHWICSQRQSSKEQSLLEIETQSYGGFALSEASGDSWYPFVALV